MAATLSSLKGTYVLDPAHTRIGFWVRHAMVTKVRGSFTGVEGTAVLDGSDPSASSVTVTVKADTFDTGSADRDAHVKSADFLDVATYPELTFTSTGVKVIDDTTFEVTGDLTIRDTVKSIVLPLEFTGTATDPFGNERVGFEGTTSISRSEYGITWNAALETGGVLVSDKVALEFEISAIKKA